MANVMPSTLTGARSMEYMITRRVLDRRSELEPVVSGAEHSGLWPERLIRVATVTATLVVAGSFLQELLWVVIAVATACALALD